MTADSGPELLQIATGQNEAWKDFSMKMKVMKTKSATISKKAIVPRANIESNRQAGEQVSCFTYLGQTITEDDKCDEAQDWASEIRF